VSSSCVIIRLLWYLQLHSGKIFCFQAFCYFKIRVFSGIHIENSYRIKKNISILECTYYLVNPPFWLIVLPVSYNIPVEKHKCLDFGKQSYSTKLNLTSTTIYLSLTPHSLLNVRLQFLLCQGEDSASIEERPNLQRSALKGSTNCTVWYSYIGAARW